MPSLPWDLQKLPGGSGIAIATLDNQEDTIGQWRKGAITLLGAQSGYEIGYETVKYIVNDQKESNRTVKRFWIHKF